MAIRDTSTFFFARQPIICRKGNIAAYELLYRANSINAITTIPDNATQQLLNHTLNTTGLNTLLEKGTKAYINVDEPMLFSEVITTIPKETFVIELLETIVISDEVIARVKWLYEQGYRFALDDVICTKSYVNSIMPMLPYIDVIKLEPVDEIKSIAPFITLFKKMNITVLAEKVETKEQYTQYHELGCDLFQGYFFARPKLMSGSNLNTKSALVIHGLALINQDKLDEFNELVSQDATLTFQLLRYINSANFSFRSDIKSIRQATALLGTQQLKQWMALMSYALSDSNEFHSPLLRLAQERSNMMMLLSQACNQHDRVEQAGLIGMLSLIDALLQRPMDELLEELRIDPDIAQILLRSGECPVGQIYELVVQLEAYDQHAMDKQLRTLDIDFKTFATLIDESYQKTEAFLQSMNLSSLS